MPGRPAKIYPALVSLLSIILVGFGVASAQSVAEARLSSPDVANFPHITTFLDIHDGQGQFIHGLNPQDVTVQEDSVPISTTELTELSPGVQFVIAISPGSSFTIRDGMGTSRYDYFRQGFFASPWFTKTASSDDLSLLTLGGPQLTHTTDLKAVKSALESFSPDSQNTETGLETLASALQVASDPTSHPGMERAILYITSPQTNDISLGLQSIIASANQQDVHIYVWVLAAAEAFQDPEIAQLRSLADQTGGLFWGFSRNEPVPDLEAMLEPLRYVYQLGYDSQVINPGSHQVAVQVAASSETITSQPQEFEINPQPPVVTLLDAPAEIARSYPAQPTPPATYNEADLLPTQHLLHFEITFPDGYDHSVVLTRLYVDGAIASESSNPPFDQVVWDIRPYTQDGTHSLSVEVTDNLGMVGRSREANVKISVPSTTQGMLVAISQKSPLLVGASVIVIGSVVALILIVGGHIRPKPHPGQPKVMKRNAPPNRSPDGSNGSPLGKEPDPGKDQTANFNPTRTRPMLLRWLAFLPWLKPKEAPTLAKAYLTPLVGFDEPTLPAPLQIITEDVMLGKDPRKASLVISDPSLDDLHARIHYDGNTYLITDAGTVSGTWVNYDQVGPAGRKLVHMDIIHLGRIGFRFLTSEPGQQRKITVTPIEPGQ